MITEEQLRVALNLTTTEMEILLKKDYAHLVAKKPTQTFFTIRQSLTTSGWDDGHVDHSSIRTRIINGSVDSDITYFTENGLMQFYRMKDGYVYHYHPDEEATKCKEVLLGYVGNLGKVFSCRETLPHAKAFFNEIVEKTVKWDVWRNADTGNLFPEQNLLTLREYFKDDLELKDLDNEQLKHLIADSSNFIQQASGYIK